MKVWVMLCAVCAGAAAHARIAHASLATPRAARANTLAGRATTSERRRVRAVTLRGGSGGEIYSFLGALDLMGTAVFAFSGTIAAGRANMDLLGCIVVAAVTCVGGGSTRDVLIGRTPVFWLREVVYLEVIVACSFATFLFWPRAEQQWRGNPGHELLAFADALGMGAFAVLGSDVAIKEGCSTLPCVCFGLMSATFGGLMRDVLTRRPVRILHARIDGVEKTLYGTAALVGSIVFVFLRLYCPNVNDDVAAAAGFLATCGVRITAYRKRVVLPSYLDKFRAPRVYPPTTARS